MKGNPRRPRRPAWLDVKAKRQWDAVCDSMEPTGLLSPADAPALALAMIHWAMARRAAEQLAAADEMFYVDNAHGGRLTRHPAHTLMREHSIEFREWAKQFGLTPAARLRMEPPEVPDVDDEGSDTWSSCQSMCRGP